MDQLLKNKVALITGAGSGIGQATAVLFAQRGAKVIVSDVNEKGGRETVDQIMSGGGEAKFIACDVSRPQEVSGLISQIMSFYGTLDIAFNNAGIGGESNPIASMSIEGWNQIIGINLSSVFYCMKYELEVMEKKGKGVIVNMSSILGQVGFVNSAGYVAAKHGVVGLTKNAALEYSAKGIRVNAVGPAFIDTPLLKKAGIVNDVKKSLEVLHPIGRFGTSQEVAEFVLWLCSDMASFVTGGYYAVDGGYLAQ